MIPVTVHKITFHPPSRSYAVILKEIDEDRSLPVIVGSFEAQSIALAMEKAESPRPLTHDLIGSLIHEIESKLNKPLIIFTFIIVIIGASMDTFIEPKYYSEQVAFILGIIIGIFAITKKQNFSISPVVRT